MHQNMKVIRHSLCIKWTNNVQGKCVLVSPKSCSKTRMQHVTLQFHTSLQRMQLVQTAHLFLLHQHFLHSMKTPYPFLLPLWIFPCCETKLKLFYIVIILYMIHFLCFDIYVKLEKQHTRIMGTETCKVTDVQCCQLQVHLFPDVALVINE